MLKSNVEALKGDDNELKGDIKALGDFFKISWLTKPPSHENATKIEKTCFYCRRPCVCR